MYNLAAYQEWNLIPPCQTFLEVVVAHMVALGVGRTD